jgi:hypothetical protein
MKIYSFFKNCNGAKFHTKRKPIFHQQEEHPQISLKMKYSIQFFIYLQKNTSEFSKNSSKDNIISVEWYY